MAKVDKYKREIELMCSKGHRTADEIFKDLKKHYLFLGIGSVYRNLTELVEEWVLMKYDQLGGRVMYEKSKPPHAHLYCRSSGTIKDVPIDQVAFDSVDLPDIFVCEDVQVTFSGYYKERVPDDCKVEIKLKWATIQHA